MYINREVQTQFEKIKNIYLIVAVVGPRQAGKTTFLKEQIKNKNSEYLLFDDPDIREIFDEDIKKFERKYLSGKEVVVLDEIQYAKTPGQKLKYLADTNNKLWLTSSSEILLGKKVLSYLVGRVSILRIYPFSIHEFFASKNITELTPQIIERETEEHAIYGGYPKVVLTKEIELKQILLRDLRETMLLKDVAKTFSIQDINSLERFTQYLAINSGEQMLYETVFQTIGVSFQTIKKYLEALEKSYFMISIKPYYTNKNKELSKRPKIYLLDTGLRNSMTNTRVMDGKIFENYVATELIKAGHIPKYWRTKTKVEVDFIIEKNNEIIPIEVKLSEQNIGRGIQSFIQQYKPKKAYIVIHKGKEQTLKRSECTIKIIRVDKIKEELGK